MKAKTKQICKKAFVWAFYLLVLVFIVFRPQGLVGKKFIKKV